MHYILLIYSDENHLQKVSEKEGQRLIAAYGAFTEELQRSGAFRDAGRLHPARTATTVQVKNNRAVQTDGPFAETKEQLGGYYVIECDSQDQALAWAAKVPSATYGRVEVRPIWPHEDPTDLGDNRGNDC